MSAQMLAFPCSGRRLRGRRGQEGVRELQLRPRGGGGCGCQGAANARDAGQPAVRLRLGALSHFILLGCIAFYRVISGLMRKAGCVGRRHGFAAHACSYTVRVTSSLLLLVQSSA
jgi:hypothetical protein